MAAALGDPHGAFFTSDRGPAFLAVRSVGIMVCVDAGSARFIEMRNKVTMNEIISHMVSAIDWPRH